jgi:regulator of replication initiation timing
MTISIWQFATWLTLVFIMLTIILQLTSRRNSEILEQSRNLSVILSKLHEQVDELNKELERLSKENSILQLEIEKLHTKVNHLQNQIFINE